MQPNFITINVASFNVGTEGDWLNLYTRSKWKEAEGKDIISPEDIDKIFEFQKKAGITKHDALKALVEKVSTHLSRIIKEFNPDILCLQEYFYNEKWKDSNAHTPIKQFLESQGYKIVGEAKQGSGRIDDLAIAYKCQTFEHLQTKSTFPTGDLYEPARFADLKHKVSGIVVRAISDHVAGFDSTEQKKHKEPSQHKKIPTKFEERRKFFDQNVRTASGNNALDKSLHCLETGKDSPAPSVFVYALDANSTSKNSNSVKKNRLHPKRMRLFEMYGYLMDHANQNATILDGNEIHPRKYDYICVKACSDKVKISIKDQILQGINDPALLRDPKAILSDHLPVLSNITISQS